MKFYKWNDISPDDVIASPVSEDSGTALEPFLHSPRYFHLLASLWSTAVTPKTSCRLLPATDGRLLSDGASAPSGDPSVREVTNSFESGIGDLLSLEDRRNCAGNHIASDGQSLFADGQSLFQAGTNPLAIKNVSDGQSLFQGINPLAIKNVSDGQSVFKDQRNGLENKNVSDSQSLLDDERIRAGARSQQSILEVSNILHEKSQEKQPKTSRSEGTQSEWVTAERNLPDKIFNQGLYQPTGNLFQPFLFFIQNQLV
jgi:hypothetical protein